MTQMYQKYTCLVYLKKYQISAHFRINNYSAWTYQMKYASLDIVEGSLIYKMLQFQEISFDTNTYSYEFMIKTGAKLQFFLFRNINFNNSYFKCKQSLYLLQVFVELYQEIDHFLTIWLVQVKILKITLLLNNCAPLLTATLSKLPHYPVFKCMQLYRKQPIFEKGQVVM